jgi:hypothetical protein
MSRCSCCRGPEASPFKPNYGLSPSTDPLQSVPCTRHQAKDKTIAAVEKVVKALKDDSKKNGELYVKFLKKSIEKVSWQQQQQQQQ